MVGTGVPLLVHSCMCWSWIRLRLSWATTSLGFLWREENTSSVWGRGVPRRSDTGSGGLF
jgi:hypothetical protein